MSSTIDDVVTAATNMKEEAALQLHTVYNYNLNTIILSKYES